MQVQLRLFDRVNDLLKAKVAMFVVADILTEVRNMQHCSSMQSFVFVLQIFASGAKISLRVREQHVDSIFEAIVDSRNPYTQAQFMISLQALAKVSYIPILQLKKNEHITAISVYDYFSCCHRLKNLIFQ